MAEGRFVAYAADTGKKLWQTPANTGVMAGPISYTIDGQQYVTVEAGWGGAFPLALGGISTVAKVKPEARGLTYKIGGNAKLPAPDPSQDVLTPPPPAPAGPAPATKRGATTNQKK